MSPMRIIVLLFALGAAALAATLAGGLFGPSKEVEAAPAPQINIIEVLVAARDMDVGHVVTAADLRWQAWPKEAASSMFITKENIPGGIDGMAGAVARAPVYAGEPVTSAKLIRAETSNVMAAMLSPGMRAISVPITEETGAGGFILPNDRVDVIVTIEGGSDEAGRRRVATQTLLQNVRVLAVGQTMHEKPAADGSNESTTVAGKTATLEVSPAEAELMQQGARAGTLSLALRGLTGSDTPVAELRVPHGAGTGRPKANQTMTIIRYGAPRQVQQQANK